MKIAIVFESMFGNTEALSEAVALGLRDRDAEVTIHRAGDAGDHVLRGCDLLVLAAPTHALALSRPASRSDAVTQGADPAHASTGLREWLAALDDGSQSPVGPPDRPPVAVFDTRARIARHWPGSAARGTARSLRKKGFEVRRVTSFFVDDVKGPLLSGELERARSWGRLVAQDARDASVERAAGA